MFPAKPAASPQSGADLETLTREKCHHDADDKKHSHLCPIWISAMILLCLRIGSFYKKSINSPKKFFAQIRFPYIVIESQVAFCGFHIFERFTEVSDVKLKGDKRIITFISAHCLQRYTQPPDESKDAQSKPFPLKIPSEKVNKI